MYANAARNIRDITLPDITDDIAVDSDALRLREEHLDRKIMSSTNAMAQQVAAKLFHQLGDSAPDLFKEIMNG